MLSWGGGGGGGGGGSAQPVGRPPIRLRLDAQLRAIDFNQGHFPPERLVKRGRHRGSNGAALCQRGCQGAEVCVGLTGGS